MHIKVIRPGDQDFGEQQTQLVKLSSRGLRGDDLNEFIKRAGFKMADTVRNMSFAPGETPIHLIALGATEYYGPNRNGDGFTEACCKQYHDTFVKHARFYRNHANKDTKKSYGIIKASMYNDAMHRIELIAALNGTKEVAARNGGLVADDELDILEKKAEMGVSMACRVAYDVCSMCGNRARTKADYCSSSDEGGSCIGGGCMNKLGQVLNDGRIQYVDNPHPLWFDMSRVWKPADRIAYVFGPLEKAAGIDIVSPLTMYENNKEVTAPWWLALADVNDATTRERMKLAGDLAELEHAIGKEAGVKGLAFAPSVQPPLDLVVDEKNMPGLLASLAVEKVALPLREYIRLFYEQHPGKAQLLAEKAGAFLPNIYSWLISKPDRLETLLTKYAATFKHAQHISPEQRRVASKLAADYSLEKNLHQRRCHLAVIRGDEQFAAHVADVGEKLAEDLGEVQEIAEGYAIYKLAFLDAIRESDKDFHLTRELVLRQNRSY